MPKTKLTDTERICIAALQVLGRNALDMAYRLVNPTSKARDNDIFHRQALRWWNLPLTQSFSNDLKAIRAQATNDTIEMSTEEDTPVTRSFLIKTLRDALKGTTSPSDRAAIAMKLADLTGLKKPQDEKETEERRRYFLPWVSHCRTCKLMEVYLRMLEEKKQDA